MMNLRLLSRKFYAPSAAVVAPRLLGHWLIRRTREGICGGAIVEVEAYLHDDPACHGFAGETPRNRTMWGKPGRAYVYFIYGNHFCVNAVCCPAGIAEAVLVRAIEPAFGEELLRRNRPMKDFRRTTNGPGKLCAALKIDRTLDGADLCASRSPLFIACNPAAGSVRDEFGPVKISARVGISRGAELALRFYLPESPFVSCRP